MDIAHFGDLEMVSRILESTRERYGFGDISARHGIFFAAFGQNYLDEVIENLAASPGVKELEENPECRLFVITSEGAVHSACPPSVQTIRVGSISDWPDSERLSNRFYKWGLPLLFPNIGASIYLDADIVVVAGAAKLVGLFEATEREGFIVNRHPRRRSWKEEYSHILFRARQADTAKLRKHFDHLEQIGVPLDMPVCQNKMLARKHGSTFDRLSLLTLGQIHRFSERDQLGFMAARHAFGSEPSIKEEGVYLYKDCGRIDERTLCFASIPFKRGTYRKSWNVERAIGAIFRLYDRLSYEAFRLFRLGRIHERYGSRSR